MNLTKNLKSIIFLIIFWLLVLFAFITEYYLLRVRDEYHSDQLKTYSRGTQVNFKEIHPSKSYQYLERASHITVIIGTVIWGYGDLIFK